MTDDEEREPPLKPRATYSVKMPDPAAMAAILADQEKRMTAAERAFRDMKRGIPPFPETRAEKAFREIKLGIGVPEAYWKSAIPEGFTSGITATLNAAASSAMKGSNAAAFSRFNAGITDVLAASAAKMSTNAFAGLGSTIGKNFPPFTPPISATALAAMNAQFKGYTAPTALAAASMTAASLQALSASWPKIRPHQVLPPGALTALQAAQMSAMRSDFGAMTDRPVGVLGRLDSALHVDLGLGAAVDSLIAAPKRNGPLGFDYGAVQRRTRDVDNLLSENPASADLADAVEEAQEITGLDDDVMDGLSIFLGVPPPGLAVGPTATRILFIATVGTACVISDVAMGQVVTLTGLIGIILNGAAVWALLHKGGEGE